MNKIFLLLCFTILAGCGFSGIKKQNTTVNNSSTLCIARSVGGFSTLQEYYIDDDLIAKLYPAQYFCTEVTSGNKLISVEKRASVTLDMKPGEKYNLRSQNTWLFISMARVPEKHFQEIVNEKMNQSALYFADISSTYLSK